MISLASRLVRPAILIAGLASLLLMPAPVSEVVRAQQQPTHTITWDSHSLLIDGKPLIIYSGEFHYFRLPSQQEWLDRLEKMKAAGLNAISVYFDWQYHSPAPGVYDFSGIRDIDRLLTIADGLGLYVIARVGPYMNAEVDAGGLPGWVLTNPLFPRAQSWDGRSAHPQYSALYSQYSREWYDHLLPILARHQATDGKSLLLLSIENEYNESQGSTQYMQELYDAARADGIKIPIFHNDFWFQGQWSKLVDLYGFDSYPYGFNCCGQWYDNVFGGVDTWETTLRTKLGITTPMFVPELQGGSFDHWGGQGYDAVAQRLDASWLSALDESALAQGTTILNTYMFAGGTSWGYMSAPSVYTSYDYGAPIAESGVLRPSYYAAHRLGMFLQSFGPSLARADASPASVTASTPSVVTHTRADAATGQTFVFLRHGDPASSVDTRLHLALPGKTFVVPQKAGTEVTLAGHGSAVLLANSAVGPLHLNYTTSSVLTDAATAQGHYLVLYGPDGTEGETDFVLPAGAIRVVHNLGVEVTKLNGELRLNYRHTADPRTVLIQTPAGDLRLLIASTDGASRFWYDRNLLLEGPSLLTDDAGKMTIENAADRNVSVFGVPAGGSLRIDGRLTGPPDDVMGETLLGRLAGPGPVALPSLTSWRFAPESPEILPSFDDSSWAAADHTSTNNPNVPQGPSLLADDYGFHYGFVWYRGHFTAAGSETGVTISARQSYALYLNGTLLGNANESLSDPPHPYAVPQTFAIPPGVLHAGADNVLAVLTESLGHDEGWLAGPLAQSPQGLLSAKLEGSTAPIAWRVQGDAGGENPVDTLGGILNASGLYGERNGWYLSTYSDASWQPVTLPDSWKGRGVSSAIGWYRTTFDLRVPAGVSASIGLTIPHVSDKAVIWLNGLLVGRYWEERGPQHTFYLPNGVLDSQGRNTLAIAVWNRGHEGGINSQPTLTLYGSLLSHSLAGGAPDSQGSDYWHTSGNRIVDSRNRPVRIAAVNWAGMQNRFFVPGGLDKVPLDAIMTRIRDLGFNTIRLPFSNQLVEQNPVVTSHVGANPNLQGVHALDVLDRIVTAARSHGLRIILEDHRSSVGSDPEVNGLWYTTRFPEGAWIHDWQVLAARYKNDPTVVGVDLRNEPHTGPPGPWSIQTYLHQGATWGPYRGVDNPRTDWRLAAERGGDAVLAVNPHLLIFVEGIQQYPDPSQPGGLDTYWWGGVLTAAARFPVVLSVPHQLVYSPHEYGPYKYQQPFFGKKMTYDGLKQVWKKHWAFLEQGPLPRQTPIFIGEFGTCGASKQCVADTSPGSQGQWFQYLVRYLRNHPEIGWSFWALNGTDVHSADQPNYIFGPDWQKQRMHQLVDALRDVEAAPPPERRS